MRLGLVNGRRSLSILVFIILVITFSSITAADTKHMDNRTSASVWQDNPYGITVTRWPEIDGGRPIRYSEWKSTIGEPQPFSQTLIKTQKPPTGTRAAGFFCIFVNSSLQSSIQVSLDQYLLDIAAEGYTSEIIAVTGGTPPDLRATLQTKYGEGMIGALLIGDLPIPWFEYWCWDDPMEHEEFPCDLYYMDMDGYWYDNDVDSIYDEHTGDLGPEIWVGRLTASPLTYGAESEANLVNNYFQKNHAYRTGQLILNNRALVYIDDDWQSSSSGWYSNVGEAYEDRTFVNDPYTTTASDFKSYLPDNYESILLAAHSGPTTHWFKIPPDIWHSYVNFDEIVNEDPVALFYNLFACSNARYVEYNYMGGWYIFCDTYGLASIGSTKTGAMLDFKYFYRPIGQDKSIGEAFHDWFNFVAEDGVEQWEICWHYGMTLCGDPTLVRHMFSRPSISTEALPAGDYDQPYYFELEAVDGIEPYDWNLIGILPAGLFLNNATGVLWGHPDTSGIFNFSLYVWDSTIPALSDTVDYQLTINYICGDANNDKQVNVGDVVYLITYIFKSGPTPEMDMLGEVNCDGAINVGDAVYLIDYVFKNGPAPCSECR